ncbi:MAG: putative scaffold protein [Prokaryotic dsDNA virus sp.]|nr:MAG: putative scaffold protein [Prokaryotic dsDNA virus sp.]
MGEGIYDGYPIVKANTDHIHHLQNNLRDADVRECIIHGSTPFRALMSGIREKKAETYTVLIDKNPAIMFGVSPIAEHLVGRIWLLGSYELENHSWKFLKWSRKVVDYFQNQYYQLENVVPADHIKTLQWLGFLGFEILNEPLQVNGFEVLRFVRCKGEKILVNSKEQPCY